MSKNEHAPETQATKYLKANKVPYASHLYAYEEHGGTKVSARELNVDEHALPVRCCSMDNAKNPIAEGKSRVPHMSMATRHFFNKSETFVHATAQLQT